MPNATLARQVLEHIEAHPETWNQDHWALRDECGTAYCFAGHAVHKVHPDAEYRFTEYTGVIEAVHVVIPGLGDVGIRSTAQSLLGLTDYGADVMFEGTNTLEHLREYVTQLEQPDADGDLVCVNPRMGGDEEDDGQYWDDEGDGYYRGDDYYDPEDYG